MAGTYTYPGVYIEEISSGVNTISGVATSITAFIGWANQGPTDHAQLILSWQDFERQFGGLNINSYLGYAVNQFFGNGGQQAYVIRLTDSATAAAGSLTLNDSVPNPRLKLTAQNPGAWAHGYAIAIKARSDDPTRFSLTVVAPQPDGSEVAVESFQNLSMDKADPRFVETIVDNESQLINASVLGAGATLPADTTVPSPLLDATTAGADGNILSPNSAAFESALNPVSQDSGMYFLDTVDLFNLLCIPGETTATVLGAAETYCRSKRAFLIADCASDATFASLSTGPDTGMTGADSINAAFYFPWISAPDPLQQNYPKAYPPCGFVAGIYSKIDANRGVFKAPAGIEASLSGVLGPVSTLTDTQNGILNVQAINCIRTFPVYGTVIWGSRTLSGNDERGSDWKYIPVRRLALYLEESLYRGTKWVVFEPNDEPLWSQIRLNIGSFLHDLFRQGAFQGSTPSKAYFVKCDQDTTTQNDINRGIVNIVVGFAPLKPAEFVVIKIQQMAGNVQT